MIRYKIYCPTRTIRHLKACFVFFTQATHNQLIFTSEWFKLDRMFLKLGHKCKTLQIQDRVIDVQPRLLTQSILKYYGTFSNYTQLISEASGHSLINSLAINTLQKLLMSIYDIKLKVQLTHCLLFRAQITIN